MFANSIIARRTVVLAAALLAAPLAAQEGTVVSGQRQAVYQERVSFDDLDLSRWSAQQALKARVSRASQRVCNQAEAPFANNELGFAWAPSCAERTYSHAKPQIAAAIARAKSGQPQMAIALVIPGLARAR